MFKKIFGKRPNRSLTVQESLVVLLLLGVYAGLLESWPETDRIMARGYTPGNQG